MEQPSGVKKTEQLSAIMLLSVVIIIALIYLVIKPQLQSLKANNLLAASKKVELKSREQEISNLKELGPKIQAAQDTVKKLSVALPEGSKAGELLVQIEAMASVSGLNIAAFSPSKEEAASTPAVGTKEEAAVAAATTGTVSSEPTVGKYSFVMSVNGPYVSIVSFLKTIEANLRPVKIIRAELSGGDGGNPDITATLTMETYYQK